MRYGLALICLVGFAHVLVYGQAEPTATRSGSLQVGGTFQEADSDYAPERFLGFGFYSTFNFRYHLGFESEFHQIDGSNTSQGVYERSYEIGPRYVLHYGRFQPYAKVAYGRGVFNFPSVGGGSSPKLRANLAYNIAAAGAGVDYRVTRSVTLRAAFEYQAWMGFPPHGLTPKLVELGAAYHFH
jgi:opacity protein-like surface antigen